MDELQLEEQQKTNQQSQDQAPYDPTAASRFPGGYTPVGEGVDNTPVEQVLPISVEEVEVTAGIDLSNPALESLGSSGDYFVPNNITLEEDYNAFGIPITPVKTNGTNLGSIDIPTLNGDVVGDISIPSDPEQQSPPVSEQPITPTPEDPEQPITPVDPLLPPVDPEEPDPEDPEEPDPEDPEEPDPEDPEEPDPEDPEDPEEPDPEDPEDPEEPDDDGDNEDEDPPCEDDHDHGGGGGKPQNKGNNGWGNGDDDAPGNSLDNNNAENDQTPNGHTSDLIDKFLKDHPSDKHEDITYNWKQDTDDFLDYPDELPVEMMDHVDLTYIDHIDHSNDFSYHSYDCL